MAFLDFLDPIGSVLSGGIGAIGSLISGNKVAAAQREANAQNYKMFKEQLGFTEDMWNKNNAYNTPAEQRKRFEEAGINPYFALSKMEAGNAQSVTTPAPNPAIPVDAAGHSISSAAQSIGVGVSSALTGYRNQLMLAQQIAGQSEAVKAQMIKNRFAVGHERNQLQKEWYELQNMVKSGKLSDAQLEESRQRSRQLRRQIKEMDLQLKYMDARLSAQTKFDQNNAERAYHEAREAEAKADYQEMVNEAFPALNAAQLNSLAASAYQAYKAGDLSREMSETEKVKRVGEILSNGIASHEYTLKELQISQQELEAARRGDVSKLRKNSKIFRFVDDVITYAAEKGSLVLGGAVGAGLKGVGSRSKSFSKGVQTGPNTFEWH